MTSEEKVREALNFAIEKTGLPLQVKMQMNGGTWEYQVEIAINTAEVAPKPLGLYPLTDFGNATQTACALHFLAVGWLYGSKSLRLGQKPPFYGRRRQRR